MSTITLGGLRDTDDPGARYQYYRFQFNRIVGNWSGTLINTTITVPQNPLLIFGFEEMQLLCSNAGNFQIWIYLNTVLIHYAAYWVDCGGGYWCSWNFTSCISHQTLAAGTYSLKIDFYGSGTNFYVGNPVANAQSNGPGYIRVLAL